MAQLKTEVEGGKIRVAREIANKTKIAKSLDESLALVRDMEEMTQQWQLEVREKRQRDVFFSGCIGKRESTDH